MPTIYKPKLQSYLGDNKKIRAKYYNLTSWKKLRQWYLMQHPLCELCEQEGITTPAEDVHHIKSPFSYSTDMQIKTLLLDEGNLMSLCKACHGKIHSKKKK